MLTNEELSIAGALMQCHDNIAVVRAEWRGKEVAVIVVVGEGGLIRDFIPIAIVVTGEIAREITPPPDFFLSQPSH